MGFLGVCLAIDVSPAAIGQDGLLKSLVDLSLQFLLGEQAGGFAGPALFGVLARQPDDSLDDLVPNPAAGWGLKILLHQQAGEAIGPTKIVHNALKQLRCVRDVGAADRGPLGEGADRSGLNVLEPGLLLLLSLAGLADELEGVLGASHPREILQVQRESPEALLALANLSLGGFAAHGRSSCRIEAIIGTEDLAPVWPSFSICCISVLR